MGLFDNLKRQAFNALKTNGNKAAKQFGDNIKNAVKNAANKSVDINFPDFPKSYEEFVSLPEAEMKTPFETAAMTVLALCIYPENREASVKMLNFLRGPRPMSGLDIGFIRDRFMDKDYVPRSYFAGAVPENNYSPSLPLKITVGDNPYSYENDGYAKLFVTSGGADSPREILLREAKDGKWYLWDQFILSDIRKPESENPWA
ncbi:MAG: hypothetical protein IJE83_01710 [Oscillospiraceae bacterium]|nr:hypothetical protein [Oscillospiraceae bacterium]MBQ2997957.1 hypothetical protein [Oscillospiraceae bacterium]MBQ4117959.1 hypothetical protein [Oscillospiraceae bacterium]